MYLNHTMNLSPGNLKVLKDLDLLNNIYPLINTRALFTGQWRFKKVQSSKEINETYQRLLKKEAWPAFEEWKARARDERILEPKAVYGYFRIDDLKLLIADLSINNHQSTIVNHQLKILLHFHHLSKLYPLREGRSG